MVVSFILCLSTMDINMICGFIAMSLYECKSVCICMSSKICQNQNFFPLYFITQTKAIFLSHFHKITELHTPFIHSSIIVYIVCKILVSAVFNFFIITYMMSNIYQKSQQPQYNTRGGDLFSSYHLKYAICPYPTSLIRREKKTA